VALIHLADGIDSVSKSANEAERGMLPATCPRSAWASRTGWTPPLPRRQGGAVAADPRRARVVKGDAAGEIATDGLGRGTREAFADRIEGILRRHIKDFDAIKLARRAYSPADLERMNVNLVGGDPYGGLCSIDQFFIWRPFAHSTNGVGLVRGLIHIGASTHPGPGLGGGSGFNAAKRLGA
jgi:phytoene dehydrogenase-like protein